MANADIKIIIVDRNPRMRDFLRREFAKRNFAIEGVSCVTELFFKLETAPLPHVVILDIDTSESSGRDLLHQMEKRFPQIPLILHTYLQDLPDDTTLYQVTAMVEKNGNPEKLTSMVTAVFAELYPELNADNGREKNNV
ncbi:response regulator [Pseudodesulfovibrio piezophilus]|uniref:Putative Response regulator receiver protein n=1 Tax=Pseudodesulfovibrio piezophilus (strain DSM 21447 / JCM 15486 / C1TLV30) TaxID=1322246 RepID=M1WQW9_PSEP2|nr:response regulator [Pseudodesulfovibrio piezophilus]CCH47927.1 putative Response regulator receiver protein [Pseudodesulfovibrio piezophilus C1TLV30]